MEEIKKSSIQKSKIKKNPHLITKKAVYHEHKSKVLIKNMFFKDAAFPIASFFYKNNLEKILDTLSKYKCNDFPNLNYYNFGSKIYHFLFVEYKNIDKAIDCVKISDTAVFYMEGMQKIDLELFEIISIINNTGLIKINFLGENQLTKSQKVQTEKRLLSELGYKARILDINKLNLQLKKFKIRPIELKCDNSYLVADKIAGNKICGYLRGKPLNKITKGFLDVFEQKNYQINKIERIKKESFIENAKLNENSEQSETEYENFLMKDKKKEFEDFIESKQILEETDFLPGDYLEVEIKEKMTEESEKILCFSQTDHNEIITDNFVNGNFNLNKFYKNNKNKLSHNSTDFFVSVGFQRIRFDKDMMCFSRNNIVTDDLLLGDLKFNIRQNFKGELLNNNFLIYTRGTKEFFRIIGSGQFNNLQNLYTQLNLIGYPKQINVNTVIVTGMFHSEKESTRFLNAKLKTLSGIRGVLKNTTGKNGDFRATFEGKMLESDIIELKIRKQVGEKIENVEGKEVELIRIEQENDEETNYSDNSDFLVAPEEKEHFKKLQKEEKLQLERDEAEKAKLLEKEAKRKKKKEIMEAEKLERKKNSAIKDKKAKDRKKRHKSRRK
ncbi:bms1 [Nucleospora cyclopteri]